MSCLVTSTTLLLSVSTSTSKFSISSFHYSIPNDLFHSFSLSRLLPLPLTAEQLPAVSSRIMRSPQPHRNGGETRQHFHSTVSLQKLKRFNSLILVFRFSGFCFTLASAVFMLTTSRVSDSLHWYNFDAFRYVFAANAIVSVYSLFEMTATVWEISRNATLLPEICQVWFDFSHDQVFAYLLLSANSAGTEMARAMKGTWTENNAFCVQSDIAIALGFVGFLFLAVSSLLSGFRVVCFIINGSRFYV